MAVKLQKDPEGYTAVDIEDLRADHPSLVKAAVAIDAELEKRKLAGMRARVVVLLDHSGSMRTDYANGNVARLLQRTLAFALNVDTDGEIEVIPFDSRVRPTVKVTVADYPTAVDRIWDNKTMSRTNMAAALAKLNEIAANSDETIVAFLLTDGNPDDKRATTAEVVALSERAVFIKAFALAPVPYLSELDDLPTGKRLIDNMDAKPEVGSNLDLLTCTDEEFAAAATDEWDTWIEAARAAGIVA